jgi:RNA polymerase sigma-70 factor (ECF subfamily)
VFSEPYAQFPTTTWSLLEAAADRQSPEFLAAMNRFAAGYWKPVFYYLRARGYAFQDAEDLTQAFFVRFLERDWLVSVDPARGRFRSFLLKVLSRFAADQGSKRAPRQAGFEQQLVAVSALVGDGERSFEPPDTETPDEIFMRHWARAVIANVNRRLKVWCEANGRPDWYRVFAAFNLAAGNQDRATQQGLARKLNLTRDQIRYALEQTKQQFVELLRSELAEQNDSSADLDEEIRELERLLGE